MAAVSGRCTSMLRKGWSMDEAVDALPMLGDLWQAGGVRDNGPIALKDWTWWYVSGIYIYSVYIYIYTHILYIYTHYHIIYTHILCICIMFQVCWPTSPPPMVCVGMHFSLFHPPMCLVGMCGSGSASVNSRRGVLTASSSRSSRSNDNSSNSNGMPPNPWGWGAGRPWTGSYKYLSTAFVYVFDVFVLILSTG